jgi:predicted membrane protein
MLKVKNEIRVMMKNKSAMVLVVILAAAGWSQAQEFKVAKSSGRLEINIGRVTVEGHSGNEIIFSSSDRNKDKDERAEGLRSVNSLGLEDNTGLGINVTHDGDVVRVRQLKKTNSPDIKILVPKNVIVSFSYESQYGGEARFRNMPNEIEVDAQYNSIELDNVTGPLTVKTIYGHVEAKLDAAMKGPISVVSVYGYVDISLPAATKANLKMSTSYGEILADPAFKIDIDRQGEMVRYSDQVNGKLNGGGIAIDLSCNYGKVYLRKI